MTVRELEDGRVLVHCFAGCSVEEVLNAVGLKFDALFPDKPIGDRVAPVRKPFPAADVLECLANEAQIVSIASSRVQEGKTLSDEEKERLKLANARIQLGRDIALGG
jgi:hypothetical protein